MYNYFFKLTLQNLAKRGVFQIINILGLSIGLAVVLLINLLIFSERSFDRSFKEGRNIYRIISRVTKFMPGETLGSTSNATGPAMHVEIPEIIAAVRTYKDQFNVRIKDNSMLINIIWADEDFFRLFDTPFIHGTPEAVMTRPNAVAISEQMAKTLYGNNNPIGETFTIGNNYLMEVVAVYRDYPENSSFREHKMIAPYMHSYDTWRRDKIEWGNLDYETFCLLNAKADTSSVNAQMRKTLAKSTEGQLEGGWFYYPELQRLHDIHLHSAHFYKGAGALVSLSDIGKVRTLTLLSVIILLVACINYMNLSTARAQKRSKEIGISKTVGAKRYELTIRLFFETGIFTFVSFIFAFLLSWALLPVFNSLMGEQLSMSLALQPMFICVSLALWLVTTLFAASYPALYMSGFPPLMAIRQGKHTAGTSHAIVRKVLTVGQFAVATILIGWVLIIQAQISFMNNKDLGYNPHNLIYIWSNSEALENDYRAETSVEAVSRSNAFLFNGSVHTITKGRDDKMGLSLNAISAVPSFIDAMQMKLIAGRPLPEQHAGDTITPILLNRAAVEYLEMMPEEAIGKSVLAGIPSKNPVVCGVVENFHYESLHSPIRGFCIYNAPGIRNSFIMLRLKKGNLTEQLKTYEQIFKKHHPNSDFSPNFADLTLEKAYEGERRTSRIAVLFSLLAILVACMGVFGLTAFMAEQRTKEIGIRKVLGASITDIVTLFTNSYVKLLGISLVIAIPVAWWVGDKYLQGFAYRISLSWWIFVAAALITVALTLFTVSFQAVKAAMVDPVKSIKTE